MTVGMGATGSTFLSYVLGEIGKEVGWEKGVIHSHSRDVSTFDHCKLTMIRDFRDIVCSTLKRGKNCMNCPPEKLTARNGALKDAFNHNFPPKFLNELYYRYVKNEITIIRYGNIFPHECAKEFFALWIPKYFGLESQIQLKKIISIVDKYSLESQKERLSQELQRRAGKQKISWKESIEFPGLSGNLHLHHISNNGRKDSWKNCFTDRDKEWLNRRLRRHLLRFNYSVSE